MINEYTIVVKHSKFIAYLYEVKDIEDVKKYYLELKTQHPKAKHIPYAYIIHNSAGKSDDKEPNGSAGLPIYNLLLKKNIQNKMICVVRYFGGTKLGIGPLMRTYLNAAQGVLKEDDN
jgi:putative IMPACT (imprinted ancient) family translation regulator